MKLHLAIMGVFVAVFMLVHVAASLATSSAEAQPAPVRESIASPVRPVIVELFTSQGCSSCPQADQVLQDIADTQHAQVLPLSMHVDYWNYIGWEDPYSSAQATARQRAYGSAFSRRGIYTPQAVIDGQYETIGSYRRSVQSFIKDAQAGMVDIPINLILNDDELTIMLPETSNLPASDIIVIGYESSLPATKVTRGENRGKTLSHPNVVRSLERVGPWRGEAATYTAKRPATEKLVVIIQQSGQRTILGAQVL